MNKSLFCGVILLCAVLPLGATETDEDLEDLEVGVLTSPVSLEREPVLDEDMLVDQKDIGVSVKLSRDEIPVRGERADWVESHLGRPASKSDPVGEPAISKWYYQKFVVYFEKDRVLHTVKLAGN